MEPEEKIYTKNLDFVQREIAGEFLLIPVRRNLTDSNALYVLNPTGAEVWKRLDGGRSLAQIKKELLTEFDVASDLLGQDLSSLVADLLAIQAIQEKT